jgi:hypothetical protein
MITVTVGVAGPAALIGPAVVSYGESRGFLSYLAP